MLQTAGGIERFVASFIRVNILLPCHTISEHNIKNGSRCIHVEGIGDRTGIWGTISEPIQHQFCTSYRLTLMYFKEKTNYLNPFNLPALNDGCLLICSLNILLPSHRVSFCLQAHVHVYFEIQSSRAFNSANMTSFKLLRTCGTYLPFWDCYLFYSADLFSLPFPYVPQAILVLTWDPLHTRKNYVS